MYPVNMFACNSTMRDNMIKCIVSTFSELCRVTFLHTLFYTHHVSIHLIISMNAFLSTTYCVKYRTPI